jgi:hypothetical protein
MKTTIRILWLAPVWLAAVVSATVGTTAQEPASRRPVVTADARMFAPSGECLACHNNLVSPSGEDVSVGASWRGTMMANSARDPYWQASVRRETIDHPSRSADIQDECAACHMPTAQKMARAAGGKGEVFAHLPIAAKAGESPVEILAADGITCTVCHQIAPDRLGTRDSFNGNFTVAPPLPTGTRRIFGPYEVDAGRRRIMHSVTGFEQATGAHVRDSELCATCHTLITEALGPDGRVIGSLPEQMNYQEWRHSTFFTEKKSCQSCHMPVVQGPVRISSVLGDYRDSLSRHAFVGGNAFMLRLLNRYRTELGVEATPAELEATARATVRQIEQETGTVAIEAASVAQGALTVDVAVRNLTGHKFPTGYPARRAWLHLTVRDASGRVQFESGRPSADGSIAGSDSDANGNAFEPHYAEITAADQVQVYESIMGTPGRVPTTGLLQATMYLKDNRLLPAGFDKATAAAEIAVVGGAASDADFTGGGDRVRYRIAVPTATGLTVDVELRYQPIGYRWAQNLASYDAAEPKAFVGYYNTLAPASSLVVARAQRRIE